MPQPNSIDADIRFLTQDFTAPEENSRLRGPVLSSLVALGHKPDEAQAALNRFFVKETVH